MAYPETPCEWCPVLKNNLELPCFSQTSRHQRLCEHAKNGHQGYINIILENSVQSKEQNHFSLGSQSGITKHIVPIRSDRTNKINDLARIKSCKHLELCGCGGGRLGDCDLGLGDNGKVNISDCMPCTKWESK